MPLTWKTDLSIHECIHESTVHINRIPHEEPLVVQENSIQDDTRPEEMSTITYTVTEGTTQRGQRKRISSDGFTYVLKVYFELKKYSDDIHKWNIDVLSFYVVHSLLFYSSAVVSSMCLRHTLNWSKFGFCIWSFPQLMSHQCR